MESEYCLLFLSEERMMFERDAGVNRLLLHSKTLYEPANCLLERGE